MQKLIFNDKKGGAKKFYVVFINCLMPAHGILKFKKAFRIGGRHPGGRRLGKEDSAMRNHQPQKDQSNDRNRFVSGVTPGMKSNPDNPYSASSYFDFDFWKKGGSHESGSNQR